MAYDIPGWQRWQAFGSDHANFETKVCPIICYYTSQSFIISRSQTGLAGHIATVKGYLNWYSAVEPTQWEEASALFTLYLVMTCWKKMWMWIRHWTAVGMIYQLAMVLPEILKVGLKAYLATNQTLPDIHHDDYLRDSTPQHQSRTQKYSG